RRLLPEVTLRDVADAGESPCRRRVRLQQERDREGHVARLRVEPDRAAEGLLADALLRDHPVAPHVVVAPVAGAVLEDVPAALLEELLATGEELRRALQELPLLARRGQGGMPDDELAQRAAQLVPGREAEAELEREDVVVHAGLGRKASATPPS